VDVSLLIRQRLTELGLDQKDLAAAVQVTESYISQLLARKKAPPAPGRTDIYEKIGQFLGLPAGELTKLAPKVVGSGALKHHYQVLPQDFTRSNRVYTQLQSKAKLEILDWRMYALPTILWIRVSNSRGTYCLL
jgi:transcriptional regulator with XRE-family HTH domain